jgi:hypothetical protein
VLSQASLKAAGDYSASQKGQTLVVLFDAKVIYERYDHGGRPGRLHSQTVLINTNV